MFLDGPNLTINKISILGVLNYTYYSLLHAHIVQPSSFGEVNTCGAVVNKRAGIGGPVSTFVPPAKISL